MSSAFINYSGFAGSLVCQKLGDPTRLQTPGDVGTW